MELANWEFFGHAYGEGPKYPLFMVGLIPQRNTVTLPIQGKAPVFPDSSLSQHSVPTDSGSIAASLLQKSILQFWSLPRLMAPPSWLSSGLAVGCSGFSTITWVGYMLPISRSLTPFRQWSNGEWEDNKRTQIGEYTLLEVKAIRRNCHFAPIKKHDIVLLTLN